jgi:hypothetical protein
MKKLLIFATVGMALCMFIPADSALAGIQDGLISYWTFNEGSGTVADDSVGTNDGTLLVAAGGGVAPSWVNGKFGKALQFDGISSWVECGWSASLRPTSALSVSAWVKPTSFSYYLGIVCNFHDTGSTESGYSLSCVGAGDTFSAGVCGSDGSIGYTTAGTYNTGQWHQVALVFDGATTRLFVNGSEVASTAELAPIDYYPPPLYGLQIGRYADDNESYCFDGIIDDVGVWNRALSTAEVKWLASYKIGDWSWYLSPTPSTGATLMPVTQVLSWTAGPGTLTGYDVYFGTDPNFITNPKVITNQLVTSYDPPGNLTNNTQYHWRVDIHDPNNGGPIIRIGPRWTFRTTPLTPVVTVHPQNQVVDAGATAVFTVAGVNQISYAWYKTPDPVNNTPGDDTLVGGNSDTLTINNVQLANEGYYFCKLTNGFGSASSNVAKLMTKRLVGWWKMDDDYNDSSPNPTPVNGTPVGDPAFVVGLIGTKAVDLDGDDYVRIDAVAGNLVTNDVTMNAWVKTTDTAASWFSCNTSTGGNVMMFDIDGGLAAIYDGGGYEGYSTTSVSDGQWHMVTYTRSGATGSLYVDGVRENTHTPNFSFSPNNLWSIGQEWDWNSDPESGPIGLTASDFLIGVVDDVRIYDYALDPYTIATIYTGVTSETVCVEEPQADFNGDCKTDFKDFADFASAWLDCNLYPATACP